MSSTSIIAWPLLLLLTLAYALPVTHVLSADNHSRSQLEKRAHDLPITVVKGRKLNLGRDGVVSGQIGLGDNADLLYTVPIELGGTTTAVHLDTGSSDLWVITDQCKGGTCDSSSVTRYPTSQLNSSGTTVTMQYGDSTTGTMATGPVGFDTAVIAGVAIQHQPFAAVTATTNPTVTYGAAGIFGLGFPSGSNVQEVLVEKLSGPITQTDNFVKTTGAYGPTLSRMSMTGALAEPRFSIALQRDTIDPSQTKGTLSVGKLPDGMSDSDFTWVPVRLYRPQDGGLKPPVFAPNEIYPFRWEIDIDGVFLDGQALASSTVSVSANSATIDLSKTSALIDTGNSLIRGPSDVVANILQTVSGKPDGTLPCASAHTLSFMIGGKMFPIDPRDFISQNKVGDAQNCVASSIVSTDPPSFGALFRWSLGDPFMKSNIVAFHYGNLTNPSQDPPMIGLKSIVPSDAAQQLAEAVKEAQANGGNFDSIFEPAPTAQAASEPEVTISQGSNQAVSTNVAAPVSSPIPTPVVIPSPVIPVSSPTSDNAGPDESAGAQKAEATRAPSSGVSLRFNPSGFGSSWTIWIWLMIGLELVW